MGGAAGFRSRSIQMLVATVLLVLLVMLHTNALASSSSYFSVAALRNMRPADMLEQQYLDPGPVGAEAARAAEPSRAGEARRMVDEPSRGSDHDGAQGHDPGGVVVLGRGEAERERQRSVAHADAELGTLSPSPPQPATTVGADTSRDTAPPAGECPAGRRPYHVVMTAASGLYQEWQSRIAYYHYQKQKRLNPCSEIGSFTRLFNSPGKRPDKLMDEMPTLLVSQLGHGSCDECDHGFIVMNRPWGVVQLVESEHWRSAIDEEYVMVIETDHMLMRPPPNQATPEKPVGFGFYYMIGTDPKLQPVVEKFLAPGIDANTVDAVGPSPLIVHKPMLQRLARPWWELSMRMKKDADANRVFGWVLEMWGYNLAARNMGIRHTVSKDFQVEPQGIGTDDMDSKHIYHYTFGLVIEPWRLDKRQYYGGYPPDHMPRPPMCSARSGFVITELFSEAAQHIRGWPTRQPAAPEEGAEDAPLSKLLQRPVERPGRLDELLRGTGPWKWGMLKGLYFFSRGIAYIQAKEESKHKTSSIYQKGRVGRWRAVDGKPLQVELQLCGQQYVLDFHDAAAPWSFTSTQRGGEAEEAGAPVRGELIGPDVEKSAQMLAHSTQLRLAHLGSGVVGGGPNATLAEELAGSGPWQWGGVAPLGFMRGGHLVTPWGVGTWGVTRRSGAETASADMVFADFANSEHTIRVIDLHCLRLGSTRKADGDTVGISFGGLETGPDNCARALTNELNGVHVIHLH